MTGKAKAALARLQVLRFTHLVVISLMAAAVAGPLVAAHGTSPAPLTAHLNPSVATLVTPDEAKATIQKGTPWRQATQDNHYSLRMTCPAVTNGYRPSTNAETITATCPFRIIDEQDLLGSVMLAVNPLDIRDQAFFSLHGAGQEGGPSNRSRDPNNSGTHSTFTTEDQGISWTDQPINSHYPAGGALGEFASGAFDSEGHLYIGYLWSHPGSGDAWDYTVGLYKQDVVENPIRYVAGEHIRAESDATIERVDVVQVTDAAPPADLANSTQRDVAGTPAPPTAERMLAGWFQTYSNGTGFVDAAWTDIRSGNDWTRLNETQRIGPCRAGSNPVPFDGDVYVACVIGPGYDARDRARVGEVDIWRIDLETNTAEFHATTPFNGGQPLMAGNDKGRMVYVGSKHLDTHLVQVQAGFGFYGDHWTGGLDMGPILHQAAGSRPMVDARITGVAIAEDTGTAFVTYAERNGASMEAPPLDPTAGTPDTGTAEYRKLLTAFNVCDGGNALATAFDLQIGLNRVDLVEVDDTDVWHEVQDGLAIERDPNGLEVLHVAYADYGVVQYAAVVEENPPPCPVQFPPLNPPLPPIPQALTVGNPASLVVGSAIGATSILMTAYLLAARKKSVSFVTAEDRK